MFGARALLVGTRKGRKLRKFFVLFVNSVHVKEVLVQIHRVDKQYAAGSEFSSLQECQLNRDVLYQDHAYTGLDVNKKAPKFVKGHDDEFWRRCTRKIIEPGSFSTRESSYQ